VSCQIVVMCGQRSGCFCFPFLRGESVGCAIRLHPRVEALEPFYSLRFGRGYITHKPFLLPKLFILDTLRVNPVLANAANIAGCSLCIPRCALHIPRCVLHIPRCVLDIPRCALHIPRCVLHIPRCALHIPRCVLHIPRCVLHIPRCVRCTLGRVRCPLGRVRSSLRFGMGVLALRDAAPRFFNFALVPGGSNLGDSPHACTSRRMLVSACQGHKGNTSYGTTGPCYARALRFVKRLFLGLGYREAENGTPQEFFIGILPVFHPHLVFLCYARNGTVEGNLDVSGVLHADTIRILAQP